MKKNERAINSSSEFMSEFLAESVRQYHLVKYMSDSPNLVEDLTVNLTSLLDGMVMDIPKDSPKRKQTLAAAAIIQKDLKKYIIGIDKALVEGRDKELNNPKTGAELRNEYGTDAPYMASVKAAENTIIVKSINDLKQKDSKIIFEGVSYLKRASEFFESIGCTSIASYFNKKHEIRQERKFDIAKISSIQKSLMHSFNKTTKEGRVTEKSRLLNSSHKNSSQTR